MSTPILMVTLIWQFTNIWNDFLFGVVFSGADSKPVTVGLNNLANTTSSVKELQRRHGRGASSPACRRCSSMCWPASISCKGLTAGAVKG